MRILLILLAVVVAVLAFVLDQPWLYWTAGALLVAAVGALVVYAWQRYQEAARFRRTQAAAPADRQKELSELGIVDVRPRTREAKASSGEADTAGRSSDTKADTRHVADLASSEAAAGEAAETLGADRATTASTSASEPEPPADGPAAAEDDATDPVLTPYLQAVCAAMEAHTTCLLVQDEMALAYRIEAIAGESAHKPASTTFETPEPLLTASMTRTAVTVRPVGNDGVAPELLGYYAQPPALQQVALAPVPCPEVPSTYFLVVDATEAHLQASRSKKMLAHFADLLGLLIETKHAPPPPIDEEALEAVAEEPAEPRPRREIVAEEMGKAYEEAKPLALALVHLNRAEALAEQGETVVADAETALRTRLERSAPRSRVERFGELTYGVFYNGHIGDVEPWAQRLQDEMKQAPGVLAGGVSIGVAMMRAEPQSPERLREEATEALRVAYETGTCTIVE